MSSASQFRGSGAVPLAGLIDGVEQVWGPGLALYGQEYLKTGYLKAYAAAYAPLVAAVRAAGAVAGTAMHSGWTISSANTGGAATYSVLKALYAGGNYHLICLAGTNTSQFSYGSSLASAPAAGPTAMLSLFLCSDAVLFGGAILASGIYNATGLRVLRSTGTTYTSVHTGTPAMSAGQAVYLAASASLALAVIWTPGATLGHTATSTNGTAWTERTPSGLPGTQYTQRLVYSNAGSLFVMVNNAALYTSADGITWTNRSLPSGMTAYANSAMSGATGCTMSMLAAASTTATILSGANASGQLLRSTDGTTWSVIDVRSQCGIGAAGTMLLAYDGTRFFAYEASTGRFAVSTDDGLTWSQDYFFAGLLNTNHTGRGGFDVANAKPLVHTYYQSGQDNRSLDLSGKLLAASPEYVGYGTALASASGMSSYLRIK